MQNSPVGPNLLSQTALIAKMTELTPFYQAVCGEARKSGALKSSYEGAGRTEEWEYWIYEHANTKRPMVTWRLHVATQVIEVLSLVDENGVTRLPISTNFSVLYGE